MNNALRSIAVCVVVGVSFALFWNLGLAPERVDRESMMKQLSIGSEDDPWARQQWELTRLMDPATGRIPDNIREKELKFAATLPKREQVVSALAKGVGGTVLNWSRRGPYNVGGRTRAFGIDQRTSSTPNITLIAGGVSGGLWKSTNDGATWTKTTTPDQLHSVSCLIQDPRPGQQDVWYAGTGEGLGNSASGSLASFRGNGIYKSTNNGSSWALLPSTSSNTPHSYDNPFDYVHNLAVDPTNGNVFAAASATIQRSTDGGASWSIVLGTTRVLSSGYNTDVAVTSTGIVYGVVNSARDQAGFWRSANGGTSWTRIDTGVPGFPTQWSRVVIAIAPSNQNAVYFLIQQSDTSTNANQVRGHQIWKYTYISGDGSGAGGTWSNRGGNLPLETGVSGNARFDTQGGYDITLHVRPNDENFLIVGGINLYRANDAFVTPGNWRRIGGYASPANYALYENHHPDQHAGMFLPGSSTIFYSAHDGGISKTTDITAPTVTWTSLNNGYYTTQFYTVAIDHGSPGDFTVIGGTQDNGTLWASDPSATLPWVSLFGGDGSYCAIADGRTSYYVSSQNGNMYRLIVDDFGNWGASNTYTRITPTGASGFLFIHPFVLDPNDTKMMYTFAGPTVWRNSDLTQIPLGSTSTTSVNWTQLTSTNVDQDGITAIAVSKTPANRVFYATYNSSKNPDAQLYKLDNANSSNPSPVAITGTNFNAAGYISSIAVNPDNANQIMVIFSNYNIPSIFYSSDGGGVWTDVSGNLEQNPDGSGNGPSCRWGAIVPTVNGIQYFVATSTGVYSTSALNGAQTVWAQEGASTIGNVVVDMLDFRTSDGYIVAGTHGAGIFAATISTASSVAAVDGSPYDFMLYQNYPNPFNPTTTIRFSIRKESPVKLWISDATGRLIRTLVNERRNAGTHEVVWDGRNDGGSSVASGVYFYGVVTDAHRSVRTMVLMK